MGNACAIELAEIPSGYAVSDTILTGPAGGDCGIYNQIEPGTAASVILIVNIAITDINALAILLALAVKAINACWISKVIYSCEGKAHLKNP